MELQQQHLAPGVVQHVVRVRTPRPQRRHARPQLGLEEQLLAAPVALLHPVLRGVRRAVPLQVELAAPDRRLGQLGPGTGEEDVRMLPGHPRAALQVGQPASPGDHLAGGPAAAVAPPGRRQRGRPDRLLLEVAVREGDLGAGQLGVVGVHRGEVGEDPRAVDTLPLERAVRKGVPLVPGDLLGQEPLETGPDQQLRQCPRIAEAVRQPGAAAFDAELVAEEALPVQELPDQRLAAGQHRVRLDPHAADRHEPPVRHRLLDPGVDLGTVLLDPGVLLRAGHGVDEVVVLLQQGHHRAGRPGHLADGLAQRPQPGRVDVGVTDGGDPVGGRRGRTGQHLPELGAAGRRGAGDVLQIDGVQCPVEREQDLRPAGGGDVQLLGELQQHLDVMDQLEHLGLEDHGIGAPDAVQQLLARGVPVALLGGLEGHVVEQHRVGRRLDVELDRLAAGGVRGDRDPLRPGVQRPHRGAVRAVDQALGLEAGHVDVEAEVEQHLDPASGERGGHLAGDPEPGGVPSATPRRPRGARLVRGRQPRGHRDRFAADPVGGQGQRVRAGVDRGTQPLLQDARHPGQRQVLIVVHQTSTAAPTVEGARVTRGWRPDLASSM